MIMNECVCSSYLQFFKISMFYSKGAKTHGVSFEFILSGFFSSHMETLLFPADFKFRTVLNYEIVVLSLPQLR